MADQNPVPSNEWVEGLKFVAVPLGIPLLTFIVRKIAVYLKDARIKETKDWLKSEEGKLYMKAYFDGMIDDDSELKD